MEDIQVEMTGFLSPGQSCIGGKKQPLRCPTSFSKAESRHGHAVLHVSHTCPDTSLCPALYPKNLAGIDITSTKSDDRFSVLMVVTELKDACQLHPYDRLATFPGQYPYPCLSYCHAFRE